MFHGGSLFVSLVYARARGDHVRRGKQFALPRLLRGRTGEAVEFGEGASAEVAFGTLVCP